MNIALACPALFFVLALAQQPPEKEKAIDPTTLKNKVTIKLGTKLEVLFKQQGVSLVDPKTAQQVSKDPPSLSFDFRRQGENLMLITQNRFKEDLKFRALARLKGRKDFDFKLVEQKQ
jgi:hypothetical protein